MNGHDQIREFIGILHESNIEACTKPTDDRIEEEFFHLDYFNRNNLIIYTIFVLIVTILSFTLVVLLFKRKIAHILK